MTDRPAKIFHLRTIMANVHVLAAIAWPDGMPIEALAAMIDIQSSACKALGLPEDLPLTDGTID
jgi:hypothetical protein